MRFRRLFLLLTLVVFCGICIAQNQDTNFSTGPQYLANFGSPMFLQPISTPSLSLGSAQVAVPEFPSETTAVAEAAPAPAPPQTSDLLHVYYGGPAESAQEVSGELTEANASEIEITSVGVPSTLPSSIVNVGVMEMLDSRSFGEHGYGMGLAESAAFWKAHKPRAPRVYTNADVDRLHGS
jgi:hypothetical protein